MKLIGILILSVVNIGCGSATLDDTRWSTYPCIRTLDYTEAPYRGFAVSQLFSMQGLV